MQTCNMRELIKSAYGNPHWKAKVDKMPDWQIIALYHSLVERGKIKGV